MPDRARDKVQLWLRSRLATLCLADCSLAAMPPPASPLPLLTTAIYEEGHILREIAGTSALVVMVTFQVRIFVSYLFVLQSTNA